VTIRLVAGILTMLATSAPPLLSAAQARAPWVMTTYKEMKLSLEECRKRAESVILAAGFGDLQRGEWTMAGVRGDYTIVIGCADDKNVVYFIAGGPVKETSVRYVEDLVRRF
jgi:hypothetical protein